MSCELCHAFFQKDGMMCKRCYRKLCFECNSSQSFAFGGKTNPRKCRACIGMGQYSEIDLVVMKENKRLVLEVATLKKNIEEANSSIREALYGNAPYYKKSREPQINE